MTEDVHAEDGLRDALVLDFRRMFEAAVDDGPEDFRLEEEVSEAGAVDGDVGALHLLLGSSVGGSRVDGNLGLKKRILNKLVCQFCANSPTVLTYLGNCPFF